MTNIYMPPDEETLAAMNKLVHGGHPVHEEHMENHLVAQSEATYEPPEVLELPVVKEEPETVDVAPKVGLLGKIGKMLKGE